MSGDVLKKYVYLSDCKFLDEISKYFQLIAHHAATNKIKRQIIGRCCLRQNMKCVSYYAERTHGNSYEEHIDGLVQNCSYSIANALELLQSCTKPSISWCIWRISNSWEVNCKWHLFLHMYMYCMLDMHTWTNDTKSYHIIPTTFCRS